MRTIKVFMSLLILVLYANMVSAGYPQSYSIRNQNGSYGGRFQSYGNRMNIYGPTGSYQGRYEQKSGYTAIYGRTGQYQGRITPNLRIGR